MNSFTYCSYYFEIKINWTQLNTSTDRLNSFLKVTEFKEYIANCIVIQ